MRVFEILASFCAPRFLRAFKTERIKSHAVNWVEVSLSCVCRQYSPFGKIRRKAAPRLPTGRAHECKLSDKPAFMRRHIPPFRNIASGIVIGADIAGFHFTPVADGAPSSDEDT
ncbi:unnamed protein product [Lasius platythorax]|uniref:Uncharacterized protein n=1 Tax=Lasius platythorax TaxID=488582 RepID=A0AAV2PDY4_9HYME